MRNKKKTKDGTKKFCICDGSWMRIAVNLHAHSQLNDSDANDLALIEGSLALSKSRVRLRTPKPATRMMMMMMMRGRQASQLVTIVKVFHDNAFYLKASFTQIVSIHKRSPTVTVNMPPKAATYDSTGVEYHNISSFKFTNGTVLHDVKVAYRSFNSSSTAGVVLIPTCFSGWINTTLTFREGPTDALAKYHVIVVAMLGNGESASPSNKSFFPEPGELHYEDVITAHYTMLTEGLGVQQLEAVIGFSMGGQQAYHWPVMYPDFVKRAVGICTSARTSPHNYAFLEGPIAAMTSSMDYLAWKEIKRKVAQGETISANMSEVKPKRGLIAFGRAYTAWITSAEWFQEQNWRIVGGFESVEGYLQAQGENKLGWDADDLLVLARMWQMGDIGKTAEGQFGKLGWSVDSDEALHEALANIKCPVLLLPCRTDQYFRPAANVDELKYLKYGRLEVVESVWGHAAGGGANAADVVFMGEKIKDFMTTTM